MRQDFIWVPDHVSAAPLPIQLPVCGLGKAVMYGTSLGKPHTLMEDSKQASGNWLHIGSAPAIATTWGVNKLMEDLSLHIPVICKSVFSYKMNKF